MCVALFNVVTKAGKLIFQPLYYILMKLCSLYCKYLLADDESYETNIQRILSSYNFYLHERKKQFVLKSDLFAKRKVSAVYV